MKQKKCKACGKPFIPDKPLQSVCDFKCAIELNKRNKEKRARKERKEAKEKAKTRGQWAAEAQAAFNSFIRARDEGKPCISCQRHHQGAWDAGHYRARSVAPALRFNELNVHAQCVPCNRHKHGNLIEYRINLVKLIGAEMVEWLEGPHDPKKYTIEELKAIKAEYSRKARELKRGRE